MLRKNSLSTGEFPLQSITCCTWPLENIVRIANFVHFLCAFFRKLFCLISVYLLCLYLSDIEQPKVPFVAMLSIKDPGPGPIISLVSNKEVGFTIIVDSLKQFCFHFSIEKRGKTCLRSYHFRKKMILFFSILILGPPSVFSGKSTILHSGSPPSLEHHSSWWESCLSSQIRAAFIIVSFLPLISGQISIHHCESPASDLRSEKHSSW